MAAVADVIGIVTGLIGLVVGLISLYLQIRSDNRVKGQRSLPEPVRVDLSPVTDGSHPDPVRAAPRSATAPRPLITLVYAGLGGSNYAAIAILVANNPARQVMSGAIGVIGAIALLVFVWRSHKEWTRFTGYAFGALTGALMLTLPEAGSGAPAPSSQRELIGAGVSVAITAIVVAIDRYRARRVR